MGTIIRRTMFNGINAPATSDVVALIHEWPSAASVQAIFTGAAVINILGALENQFDVIAVLDTAQGYESGEIIRLSLPVGLEQLRADLVFGGPVTLYVRAE